MHAFGVTQTLSTKLSFTHFRTSEVLSVVNAQPMHCNDRRSAENTTELTLRLLHSAKEPSAASVSASN